MSNKPTFKMNQYGVKASCEMYRNIKGVHFIQLTSNPAEFENARAEAKAKGLKTRMIQGELFIEKVEDKN